MTEHEWLVCNNPSDMWEAANGFFTPRKAKLFGCACARNRSAWGTQSHYASSPYISVAERVADGERSVFLPMSDEAPLSLKALLYEGEGPARLWCSFDTFAHSDVLRYHCDIMRDLLGSPFGHEFVRRTKVPCPDCGPIPDAYCDDCSGSGWVYAPNDFITPEVVSLAEAAYEHRVMDGTLDPTRLSILADAIEEAGCPLTVLSPCPRCLDYADDPENPWGEVGYYPERDPASGRHEGGWANCKTCNCGGRDYVRPGVVKVPHPVLAHLRGATPHWRGCHVIDEILGRY